MTKVIYADVLVVLNTYLTYTLLLLTGFLSHEGGKRFRRVMSALAGGISSLILLIPGISEAMLSMVRLPLAVMLVLMAFGKGTVRRFLRLVSAYFLVSFIFAGLMLALWYFFSPSVYFNSGIVYFSIDSLTLILLTAICYVLVRVGAFFLSKRTPTARVYDMKITVSDKLLHCKGFLDTGHNLTDPFTGYPVIILSFDVLKGAFPQLKSPVDLTDIIGTKGRYLPCSTVTGEDALISFRPEKAEIRGISIVFETCEVIVAVAEGKFMGGEYGALLPGKLFDNKTNERGEDYAVTVKKSP